jgi:hypothetical protein
MTALGDLPPEMLVEVVFRLDPLSASLLCLTAHKYYNFDFIQRKRLQTSNLLHEAIKRAYWNVVRDTLTWHFVDTSALDVLRIRVTSDYSNQFFVKFYSEYFDRNDSISKYFNDIEKWESFGDKKGSSLLRALNSRSIGPKFPPYLDLILAAYDLDYSYLEDNLSAIIERDSVQIDSAYLAKVWMCNAAVYKGSEEMMELLKRHDCGAPFVSSRSLFLELAIHSGKINMVEYALDIPLSRSHDGRIVVSTSFFDAFKLDHFHIFQMLCNFRFVRSHHLSCALGYCLSNPVYADLVRSTIERRGMEIDPIFFLKTAEHANNGAGFAQFLSKMLEENPNFARELLQNETIYMPEVLFLFSSFLYCLFTL